jgi:hypothetical protein
MGGARRCRRSSGCPLGALEHRGDVRPAPLHRSARPATLVGPARFGTARPAAVRGRFDRPARRAVRARGGEHVVQVARAVRAARRALGLDVLLLRLPIAIQRVLASALAELVVAALVLLVGLVLVALVVAGLVAAALVPAELVVVELVLVALVPAVLVSAELVVAEPVRSAGSVGARRVVLLLARPARVESLVRLEAGLGERLCEPLSRGVVAAGQDVRELLGELLCGRRRARSRALAGVLAGTLSGVPAGALPRALARVLAGVLSGVAARVGIGPTLGQRFGVRLRI